MGLRSFLKGKVKRALGREAAGEAGGDTGAATTLREALASVPTEPDADGYVAVAPSGLLAEGAGNTFTVRGHNVALFRVEGRVHAIDDACNHEDGPLGEGSLDGCVVTCPYHDWRYDVATGDCLTDPARPLSCYAVRERGGFIWVGPRTREGSRDRGGQHDDGLLTTPIEGPRR